jgi:hypothetical protein
MTRGEQHFGVGVTGFPHRAVAARRHTGFAPLGLVLLTLLWPTSSHAADGEPYVAGDRLFPATPLTDSPFVADELYISGYRLEDPVAESGPTSMETDFAFSIEKLLAPRLSLEFETDYVIDTQPGSGPARGFDDPELTLKYQFYENDVHELVLSAGVAYEIGGVGAQQIGAEEVGSTTPTLYFGKGMGELPDALKFLRPLAVTGTLGYQIPDSRAHSTTVTDPVTGMPSLEVEHFSDFVVAGLSVQYSLRYLQGNVEYVGLPSYLTKLTPIVEFAYAKAVGPSYGVLASLIVAPGFIYSYRGMDFGLEAMIPASRASGTHVGFIASAHIPLATICPSLFGRPLIGD